MRVWKGNMTKEEIDVIKNMANATINIPAPYVIELIEHYEKELAASRDSRTLSAVPSGKDIIKEILSKREEILSAFIAKYGFEPDEAEQIIISDGIQTRWFIQKRGIAG